MLSVVLIYGFIGFLWSFPLWIPLWTQSKRGRQLDHEIEIKRASALLVPLLVLPVIFFLTGRLIILPTSILNIVKNIVGVLVIIIYCRILFRGIRSFFTSLSNSIIPIWKVIFSEIAIGILALMLFGGIKGLNLVIDLIIGIILVIASYFFMRGRLSPIVNNRIRYVFRAIYLVLVIIPFLSGAIVSRETKGVKTVDGNGSIILITIDALRADYLPTYGSIYTEAPNLDSFAKDAVVFDKMYSVSPWTLSSMASLATGVYPSVHGANVRTYRIQSGIPTLAENLRERGYTTAAFFVNSLMGQSSRINRGFDEFYESFTMAGPYSCLYPSHFSHDKIFMPLCSMRVIHYDSHYVLKMERKLFPWMEKNKDKKVFLWVHYYDPHAPYGPPDRYMTRKNPQGDGKIKFATYHVLMDILFGLFRTPESTVNSLKDLYAGDIDFADERAGLLLKKINEIGWMKSATVIIAADHGEEFFEHGSFEHGHSFYQELVHVPLFVHPGVGAGVIPQGREKEPVNTLDITATICDIAGLDSIPFYGVLQGKSLFTNYENDIRKPIFMEEPSRGFPNRIAVLKDDWKYIFHQDNTIREIYNLETDPLELRNLIGTVPDDALKVIYEDVKNWEETNSVLKRKLRTNPDAEDEEAKLNLRLIQGLGYFK